MFSVELCIGKILAVLLSKAMDIVSQACILCVYASDMCQLLLDSADAVTLERKS